MINWSYLQEKKTQFHFLTASHRSAHHQVIVKAIMGKMFTDKTGKTD